MLGTNLIRPPVAGDGMTLDVVEIFPTLQGEGPFVGVPALFIRLGGCNLACRFCDTEFETFAPTSLDILCESIVSHPSLPLVVITGGEPFRQPIAPLCDAALSMGRMVQIETNGTLWRDIPEGVDIVCSPKPSNGRYHTLRSDVLARSSAIKFIVSAHNEAHMVVPDIGQEAANVPVYVQPMDEQDEVKNAANIKHAMRLCMEYGYRLSLQTHKILGIA